MQKPLEGKLILIVDDEPVFRAMLDNFLTSLGATLLSANDGMDALALFKKTEPDLLICDIAMPKLNGLQLIEQLRSQGNTLPILVISATENMSEIGK